jgi:hypothetical protein
VAQSAGEDAATAATLLPTKIVATSARSVQLRMTYLSIAA